MDHSGQTIGKYKLIKQLGQGGMAQVYQAIQPTIDRPVAIKIMHGHLAENEDFLVRFKREARGMGLLRHPNIVSILDFDSDGDLYYMVMDYIDGLTLQNYLAEHSPLDAVQSLQIARQLASALAYAHHRGTIHRDIKPANVMFTDATCKDVVLTDFGIARLMDDVNMTQSGTISGTPAYMSPEAAQGTRVDDRADIYSLGIILYELVTGRTPYEGDTPIAVIMKHVTAPLPPPSSINPDIPESVERIIARSLAKKPDERFPSAAAMVSAIDRALAEMQGGMSTVQGTLSQFDGAAAAADSTQIQPSAMRPTQNQPAPIAPPTQVAQFDNEVILGSEPHPSVVAPPLKAIEPPLPQPQAASGRARWPIFLGGLILLLCIGATTLAAIYFFGDDDEDPVVIVDNDVVPTTSPSITPVEPGDDNEVIVADATLVPDNGGEIALTGEPDPTAEPGEEPLVNLFVEADRVGVARAVTADGVLATQLLIQLDNVVLPPAGLHYDVWLQGNNTLRTGQLDVVDSTAIATFEVDGNILATFDTVLITLENDNAGAAAPSDQLVYSGSLPPAIAPPILALLDSTGAITNASSQMDLAVQHAGFARDALDGGDLATGRQHAEHVINILDGNDGELFGDLDGNGLPENPGNGVGVRSYLEQVEAAITQVGALDELTGERQLQVEQAAAANSNTLAWQQRSINVAISILSSDTVGEAAANGEQLILSLTNMRFAPVPIPNQPDEESFIGLTQRLLNLISIPVFATELGAGPAGFPIASSDSAGTATLSSNDNSRAGSIFILLDNLLAPAPGNGYFAWLEATDGSTFPLGAVNFRGGLAFLPAATELNLLASFERILISSQALGTGDAISGPIIYVAEMATPERAAIGPIVLVGTAENKGLTFGAVEQLEIALAHATFLNDALASGDLALARRHAEHVNNIIVGTESEDFGDLDGSGLAENPGDGIGVLGYLAQIRALTEQFLDEPNHTDAQRDAASRLLNTLLTNEQKLADVLNQISLVFVAADAGAAQESGTQIITTLNAVFAGADDDGNGVIDPLLAEGGVLSLTELALDMAQFAFVTPQ